MYFQKKSEIPKLSRIYLSSQFSALDKKKENDFINPFLVLEKKKESIENSEYKTYQSEINFEIQMYYDVSNMVSFSMRKKNLSVRSSSQSRYNSQGEREKNNSQQLQREMSNVQNESNLYQEMLSNKLEQDFQNRWRQYSIQQDNKKSKFNPKNSNQRLQSVQKGEDFEISQRLQQSQAEQKQTKFNQKMQLLVNEINLDDKQFGPEDYKIFFLQDLSDFISQQKFTKSESIKKNLMRSISHELLTYLNGAYGYMYQVVKSQQEDSQTLMKWSELAFKYINLQLFKIQDLLDYRDIINGQYTIQLDRIILYDTLVECLDLIQDQIKQKQLEFFFLFELDKKIRVKANKQKLFQVMLNFLSNAVKYTNKGQIQVQVTSVSYNSLLKYGENFMTFNEYQNNLIQIQVYDTGIGLDEKELSILNKKLHILDEDEKISKQSVGAGMGLMVCKEIIHQMGPKIGDLNKIFVDSTHNQDCLFYFFLEQFIGNVTIVDISEDQSVSESNWSINIENSIEQIKSLPQYQNRFLQSQKLINSKTEKKKKVLTKKFKSNQTIQKIRCPCKQVLLVDDEQFNLDVLEYLLKSLDFICERAYNGQEAIEKILKKQQLKCGPFCCLYKCILMDLNMPIMTGWEAIRKIREFEEEAQNYNSFKVIAVTAFCNASEQKKCLDAGFNYIIPKPANKKKLLEAFMKFNVEFPC